MLFALILRNILIGLSVDDEEESSKLVNEDEMPIEVFSDSMCHSPRL